MNRGDENESGSSQQGLGQLRLIVDPSNASRGLDNVGETARASETGDRSPDFSADWLKHDDAAAANKTAKRLPLPPLRLSLDNQPLAGHALATHHDASYSAWP
jgi:hypothetical protein